MNQVDKIRKGQLLYVVLEGQTNGVKTVEVIDIRINNKKDIDPDRYVDIVVRYLGSNIKSTVTFFPEDFNKIIFINENDAKEMLRKQKIQRNKNGIFSTKQECDEWTEKEHMFEKIATFFEKERNWERMKNCWYSNGCSHDFRELLKEAMELE